MDTKHWHGSIEHVVYTALGVLVVFQAVRWGAARMVTADNGTVSALGKSIGALFSFPAQ